MSDTIHTGLSDYWPTCFVPTPKGDVLLFNGIDPPKRWDGKTAAVETAGIPAPTSTPSVTSGSSGNPNGTYYCYMQWVDDEGIGGNLSPATEITVTSDKIEWAATGNVSTDPRVTNIRLYRTTDGQASVAYLVTTVANNVSSTYSDNNSDATISANDFIVLSTNDVGIPAESQSRGVPNGFMSAVVPFRGRLYGAVPVPYSEGHLEVTNGSSSIVGVGTHFTSTMYGSKILIEGVEYTLNNPTSATAVTLTSTYAGTTNRFASYSIWPGNEELLTVYYSYIGDTSEPEAWSDSLSFTVPPDGGRITALIPMGGYLYVMKQGRAYRFTTQTHPAIDGQIHQSSESRGCENQRCWASVEGTAFVLDRQGVYAITSGGERSMSDAIQDYWQRGKINWSASKWFHACYDQENEVVRFFVALGASYLPRHALCYSTRGGGWWEEKWSVDVGGSGSVLVDSRRRILLGCEHGQVMLYGDSQLDGIAPNSAGTLRGTASSATITTLTDASASFPSSLADVPVSIVSGKGKGQTRRIVSSTSTKLTVKEPWLITPDSTSVYQIGGFAYKWTSPIYRLTQRSNDTERQVHIFYEPCENPSVVYLRYLPNHSRIPMSWGSGADSGIVYNERGVTITAKDPDIAVDTYRYGSSEMEDEGYRQHRFDDNTCVAGSADRWLSLQIHGHANASPQMIYGVLVDGVR